MLLGSARAVALPGNGNGVGETNNSLYALASEVERENTSSSMSKGPGSPAIVVLLSILTSVVLLLESSDFDLLIFTVPPISSALLEAVK